MNSYEVTFSAEFDSRPADIERDYLGFGLTQTSRYAMEIIEHRERLDKMLYRFLTETINLDSAVRAEQNLSRLLMLKR